jgi:tRNA modification GTPase
VAIVGKTNVGKSTLLNALLKDDRAIVSDIHGTTRDTIEDTIDINGVTFRFIDTAGIRQTTDEIEQIGIERNYGAIEKARIILWMIDEEPSKEELNKMCL